MDEQTFKRYMSAAKGLSGDYAEGYQRGLRRHHQGSSFDTESEHQQWMAMGLDGDLRSELGTGYRDGFAGRPPEAEDLSAYCKTRCGLDVSEVSELSEVPRRTLYDWWRNRRRAVELIVKGLASEHKK
ncbi:TPA: hypothetical protein ACJ51G_000989 [Aeromonas hydrophila subsp. hydrophila]|uniref:hypothetical protein n=1 Tax=Aeromonas TaxID=642 RepID=UPI000FEBA463|nr:hypothetical protein [Aeromonas caviae]RWT77737.1 hypothetical protein DN604_07140 [Aeromonas caviae]WVM48132.1 hypothetical protein V0242_24640 [Aeromonas hydrophila]